MFNLKKEMAIRNMSVKDLSKKAQMSKPSIYKMMETGRCTPSVIRVLENTPVGKVQYPFKISTGRAGSDTYKKITVMAASFSGAFALAEEEWAKEGYYIGEKNSYGVVRGGRL